MTPEDLFKQKVKLLELSAISVTQKAKIVEIHEILSNIISRIEKLENNSASVQQIAAEFEQEPPYGG